MSEINRLILYRCPDDDFILRGLTDLIVRFGIQDPAREPDERDRELFFRCENGLFETAAAYGLEGNLWHDYIALFLVRNENAFSLASEIRGAAGGSIRQVAMHDFALLKEWFDFRLRGLSRSFPDACWDALEDFQPSDAGGRMYSRRIRDRICALAGDLAGSRNAEEFLQSTASFYRDFGVGSIGLHKAFRIRHEQGQRAEIEPVKRIAHVRLEDLVGYELAKQKLTENTEAFLDGKPANNCLLFGDAGTGKSSSIKGILNRYYDRGLRIIEVYKHQFQDLGDVIARIKERNYRFILYMDDLSFEEFEIEYKYLKAVIEGGLEKKPDNVLIYATSNRRNLIRERFSDKLELTDEDDLHSSDTTQEKLSLVSRFGVRIYFPSPERREFETIVLELAARAGIEMPRQELLLKASQWELSHGGLSGRTARQFIDHCQAIRQER